MTASPPVCERRDDVRTVLGVSWSDPYEWLRTAPGLADVLDAETRHAAAALAPLAAEAEALAAGHGRDAVRAELGLPQRRGDLWLAPAVGHGGRYPRIVAMPRDAVDGDHVPSVGEVESRGRTLTDLGHLLAGEDVTLGTVQISACGRWVAWTQDATGAEAYTVRAAPTGTADPERVRTLVERTSAGVVIDGAGHVVAVRLDEAHRPATAVRVPLEGGAGSTLHDEHDPARRVRVELTTSGGWLVVTSATRDDARHAVVDACDAQAVARAVPTPPGRGSVAHVVVDGADHLIVTTVGAAGTVCRVGALRGGRPAPADAWHEVARWGPEVTVSTPLALRDHVLVSSRRDGRDVLLAGRWTAGDPPRLDLAPLDLVGAGTGLTLAVQPQWDDDDLIASPASYVQPPAARRVPLRAPAPRRRGGAPRPAVEYVEEVLEASADDGTRVPVTVVRHRATTGPAPLLLSGYGAYGTSVPARYNPMLRHLLDRGGAYAVAHVRGGGERGRAWHDAARGTRKRRSVDDLLACLDHLVACGVADVDRVVLSGASAGGLLMGAALTSAPHRFAGAVLDVPFLDPVTSMLDPEQALTVSDRHEWGDPGTDPAVLAAMRAYSPYENLRPGVRLPPVLVTCRRADSRVAAVECLKWVQRARHDTDGGPVLLLALPGGHTGAGAWQDNVAKAATELVWVTRVLKLGGSTDGR
ncbi:prolyl oligopeptidase family serine peptidase [Cellulomonas iranensis]|nr:prolyl oligopeptidase family serine peptidase [Cellulomonas iranensis]